MPALLPPWGLLSAFLAASLVLAVTPGPSVFYIVTRSASQGRRAGVISAAAIAFGNLSNAFAAAAGLAALFAVSSIAFSLVKFAGAAYLIYLGLQMIFSSNRDAGPVSTAPGAPIGKLFRDGFFVALLNPKTTLFFAAFLPQFLGAPTAPMAQAMLLGAIFVAIAWITDTLYALLADRLMARLRGRTRRIGRRVGGGVFIGLGIFTALSGARTAS